MIYLDNASTTRACGEAAKAAVRAMREDFGNPSAPNAAGRKAALLLEEARENVASLLGAEPREIYFTSGGTEADNWAVMCGAHARRRVGAHIISSAAEHDAVLRPISHLGENGCEVTLLRPDKHGVITPQAVAEALRPDTALVSIMLVNNETGAVNPVSEYAAELRRRGSAALLHTDAVQGFGKLPLSAKALGADLISVSAHKIHGVKGVGALYIKNGVRLQPLLRGGGQESAMRPGTHAMPAIAAFGEAARIAKRDLAQNHERVAKLRSLAMQALTEQLPEMQILSPEDASPYILSISLPGHRAETLMNALDAEGICVARSSACKKGARSHVLEAMELAPAVIDGALRVSFSHETTEDEINRFVCALQNAASTLFRRTR